MSRDQLLYQNPCLPKCSEQAVIAKENPQDLETAVFPHLFWFLPPVGVKGWREQTFGYKASGLASHSGASGLDSRLGMRPGKSFTSLRLLPYQ